MKLQSNGRPADRAGFTLTELLVVLAIIGILASIVIPNVTRYIAKSRVTKAVSEINNANTALTGMLSDAQVSRFRDFLRNPVAKFASFEDAPGVVNIQAAQQFYQDFFITLLRQGKGAINSSIGGDLEPAVVNKLGDSYMDIGLDPWGNQYRFWMGPQRYPVPFRSYRINPFSVPDPTDPNYASYQYTQQLVNHENSRLPGNPPADGMYGFPAPRDLPVYIWSAGPNETVEAFIAADLIYDPAFRGGGDDINNWDKEGGWDLAPK